MRMFRKAFSYGCFLALLFCFFPNRILATEQRALVISQVRGSECCSPGSLNFLQTQLRSAQKLHLPITQALRYDALTDPSYQTIFQENSALVEWAAFLEITPQLAADAGVYYAGDAETWYQAEHAYLIGYSPEDREKLIEQYMKRFESQFGSFPQTVVAWMIDATSLHNLKTRYGVSSVEITREQFGTDSYTLYGGPSHFPYFPSNSWALIPYQSQDTLVNPEMPLILRQTISDPVLNYGDQSNCYTSQANDYFLCQAKFDYFQKLFEQAQNASGAGYTFSLIGLENSMPEREQDEFAKQLAFLAQWRDGAAERQVQSARDFTQEYSQFLAGQSAINYYPLLYSGKNADDIHDQAWWIDAENYRARVRFNGTELYLSDLRIYDDAFRDPYIDQIAQHGGWWIVPFTLDASRYFANDQSFVLQTLAPDQLKDRKAATLSPTRFTLAKALRAEQLQVLRENGPDGPLVNFLIDGKIIASFQSKYFKLNKNIEQLWRGENSSGTQGILGRFVQDWVWQQDGQKLWGWQKETQGEFLQFQPKLFSEISPTDWQNIRQNAQPLLFPELRDQKVSPKTSYIYQNNQYAIAGRNPVRLVFYPKDDYGFPVSLAELPQVRSDQADDQIRLQKQSQQNGMLFIDIERTQPGKSEIRIEQDDFQSSLPIYFAANCKNEFGRCLKEPQLAYWYLRAKLGDYQRSLEAWWRERH